MFGGLAQIGKTTGFLIFYIIGVFASWKVMAVVGAVFCLVHSVFIWFTPETNEINGFSISELENDQEQLSSIKFFMRKRRRDCKCDCGGRASYESVFQRRHAFGLFSGMAMMFFQQFCGINALNANLARVMERSGLRFHPNLKSAISTSAQWLAVFVSCFILDACGRRAIWILSASGITAGLAMYTASLETDVRGWFAALCVFLIMIFFGFGFGPIPWFIGFEMFPQEVRMMGQAMINFAAMLATFAIAFINPIITDELGEFYVYIIYMIITFIAIFFGIWCVKDPDEIDGNITLL